MADKNIQISKTVALAVIGALLSLSATLAWTLLVYKLRRLKLKTQNRMWLLSITRKLSEKHLPNCSGLAMRSFRLRRRNRV